MDWKLNFKKTRIFLLIGLVVLVVFSFGYIRYNNLNINDIGLKVLTLFKKVSGGAVDLDSITNQNSPKLDHQSWSDLLIRHVDSTGKVDYDGFIKDSIALNSYLDRLSKYPPGNNWTKDEKLAYWINAYNAFTIKLIIDHYPLESIKDIVDGLPMINSPWDIKFFRVGETPFDLNTIEHEILRKAFEEPRIHFAVNCASFSCPKLRNEAYTAENLEKQLEAQAFDFLNNPQKNYINNEVTKLSKIFDWFQSDFTKQSDLKSFIDKYNNSINKNNKVEYLEYNWVLNN